MKQNSIKYLLYSIGIIFSALLSFYALWSSIFYSWMNANGSWRSEQALPWALGSLVISCIFFGTFILFIVKNS
jgi:polyferredoxin